MGHLSMSESIDAAKVIFNSGQVSKVVFCKQSGAMQRAGSDDDLDVNNNDSNKAVGASENHEKHSGLDSSGPNILGVQFRAGLKWDKIIMIGLLHIVFFYGGLQYSFWQRPHGTLWSLFTGGCAGFGVTAGAHRLWSHRSYKAKLPLRIILMLCFCTAGQNTLYEWVRDHRVHHKFSETDADPHNSKRGFFFAHVGWLMMHKHPEVLRRGRQLDMSDILNDPVVQFHQKHFVMLKTLFCFVLPVLVPVYVFNDSWYWAIISECVLRYVFSLNFTWSVNSAAHLWGKKPYDKRINPSENIGVSILAMGEGWHNYHHVFPWDYKAAEMGGYCFNITTFWIDLFAKFGWAYDLKQPSHDLVRRTIEKHGDGSHSLSGNSDEVSMQKGNNLTLRKNDISFHLR